MGRVTLTLKLVCESHQRWGTFIPNLGTLGLRVLELFAVYSTDGRTKANPTAPLILLVGLIYDFDLTVNCDKLISDQRRLLLRYCCCELRLYLH